MHHKILAGINSSPSARHAFVCTLRYAAAVQAEVVGLLVESPFWNPPRYGRQEFESAVQINAERLARQYGVPFAFKVRRGYPARTIAEQARILSCDLVVLGHAHDSHLHRWLTASVSELVRHETSCQVMVIRTGQVIDIDGGAAGAAPGATAERSLAEIPVPLSAG
ncbi:MAG TPA: universal stress protein [Chloroflexota bacterium]|nr:universal stress protein [Chloroflexota bacterium]